MIRNFKRRSVQFLFSALLLIGIAACNKDISLSLDNSRDESMGIIPVDSIQVNASTYQLDDVPTSGTGVILVGKNSNTTTGSVRATSYMRLGIGDITAASIPMEAVYDSIVFVLKPSKYFYGDTTQTQTLAVHELTQSLTLKEINPGADANELPVFVSGAALYNNQQFNYNPTAIGSLAFKPFVNKLDSVAIKLDNTLGTTLFKYIQEGNTKITSNDNFEEYFKGIALVPGDNNTAILGFRDTVFMQIHYNVINNLGFKVPKVSAFNLASSTYQYNNIETDRTGTPFSTLSIKNPELKSTVTDGQVFLEGSSGTVVKLSFPSLLALVNDPTVAINKAELVIETESTYLNSIFKLPTSLILMIANSGGNPVSILTSPFATTTQEVTYTAAGMEYGSNAKYTFNLIEYLNNIKKESYYNTSLFLSLPTTGLFSNTNRLIIAKNTNNTPKIKLNILYTKF